MPFETPNYLLESFLDGDIYSASADYRRFNTIDKQLYRVSELTGDGRITGWEITETTFPQISVSAGNGVIDGYYVNTFGDEAFNLAENSEFYVYAVRKIGIFGIVGPRSDIESATYIDAGPPAQPLNFTYASQPYSVTLTWSANTELDFDHYDLYRSDDNLTFEFVSSIEEDTLAYIDTTEEDTAYYYRLYAIDESAFQSAAATLSITTPLDPVPPPSPVDVRVFGSHSAINVLWNSPPTLSQNKMAHYVIGWVELNSDDTEKSDTYVSVNVSPDSLYYRINYLTVGQRYKVAVSLVDIKNRVSTRIDKKITLAASAAPLDPPAVSYTVEQAANGVAINLQWSAEDDPYLDPYESVTDPYRYRIYVRMNNEIESLPIDVPINVFEMIDGSPYIQYKVYLYTFDLVEYYPILENAFATIRIVSVDVNGVESEGNYLNILTPNYSPPNRIDTFNAFFDVATNRIIAKWSLQNDTASVNMYVKDDTTEVVLYNQSLGTARRYEYGSPVAGHRYVLVITPLGFNGVYGTTATVRLDIKSEDGTDEVPIGLPVAPLNIESKSGDRNVRLFWSDSETPQTTGYKVYSKSGEVSFDFVDWELLDILPREITTFTHYGLNNDAVYSYYVTAIDLYNQESEHLEQGVINLNYVEVVPRSENVLTEPISVSVTMQPLTHSVLVAWDGINAEEFHSYILWRSINNLHSWTRVANLNKSITSYLDIGFPLVHNTVYYYGVEKAVNDAEIRVQASDNQPENSIFIGKVETTATASSVDVTDRIDIANLEDGIRVYSLPYILRHHHIADVNRLNTTEVVDKLQVVAADRIKLDDNLIITDWTTKDGRIWTSEEEDMVGTSYSLRVDGSFPSTFYNLDA